MRGARIGPKVKALRRRQGLTQQELAERAGVSRQSASRIELDQLDGITIGMLAAVVGALDAHLRIEVEWHGAAIDRLLDEAHAALADRLAGDLRRWGWVTRAEVSFNHFGDRGRYDLLAFHPATGLLLVVEVKTAIGDIQDTLGRLDVKVRLAPQVGRDQGWHVRSVVPLLVVAESATNRRHVHGHALLFDRFSLRGRSALAWLRRPTTPAPTGLLALLAAPPSSNARVVDVNSRVRHRKADNARHDGQMTSRGCICADNARQDGR